MRDAFDRQIEDDFFNQAAIEVIRLLNTNDERAASILPLLVSVVKIKDRLDEVTRRNLCLHLLQIMLKRGRYAELLLSSLVDMVNHKTEIVPAVFSAIVEHLVVLVQGKHTKRALEHVHRLCRLLQTFSHTDTEERFSVLVQALHRYDAMERCIWQVSVVKGWVRFV